jgi:drug/metabolite transporter (DMT)-like permease
MPFVLASAAAFGAMAVLGKLAYEQGATVGTLLSLRFVLAALLFWMLVSRDDVRGLRRRDVAGGLALGAGVYALQAGLYFAALERIEASLLSLVVYTFPVMVAVASVLLGRETLSWRRIVALVLASVGLVLILGRTGPVDALGIALALATAVVYSFYILVGEGIASRVPARVLAALVASGAAVTLSVGSAALGQLAPGRLTLAGWGWILALAVISTVVALSLLFAGLRRVGPTTASILCNAEPVVTVVLAFAAFGEVLAPVQLAGGALVLGGVAVVSRGGPLGGRARGRVGRRGGVDRGTARATEQHAPHVREAGGQRLHELAQRVDRAGLDQHGLDLGDGTGTGLVAPGHIQVLAADDLGQVCGQDEVGVRVIDRQM